MKSCRITKQSIFVDGKLFLSTKEEAQFLTSFYHTLELNYPKFHKMDSLSKAAILALEVLRTEKDPFQNCTDDNIAFIIANQSASSETDEKFIQSYSEMGNPSPSLFVYTLPNILIGEIAIKHKWYGENTFFVQDSFDANLFVEQAKMYLNNGNETCLCAWIDSKKENLDCFMFTLNKNDLQEINSLVLEKKYKLNKHE
jgi:hypothetical protein